MSTISIRKTAIADLKLDAIVRSSHDGLWPETGPRTSVLKAVGLRQLEFACDSGTPADNSFAVLTPGLHQRAKYVIHVVGPRWYGGANREPQLLRSLYTSALTLAVRNGCHSVGFPLLSVGIFKYPLEGAWRTGLQACCDFFHQNSETDLDVIFAVRDKRSLDEGCRQLNALVQETLCTASAGTPSLCLCGGILSGEDCKLVIGA